MPFTKVRGIRLYYEHAGAGPRLLYINGSGGDLRVKPGPFEGPLGASFELLAHDQRGLGQTERPDERYTMGDYAEDAAALLDHVGWQRCRVIGVSFGGMVAQELAVRYPERIERLVLACTSSGGVGGASYPLHELEALTPDERTRRSLALADTRLDAAWQAANPDDFERMLGFMEARARVGAGEPGREVGARHQLEARRGHDVFERLPKFTQPTLVCGGRYDSIAPPDNLHAIASQLPDARVELFEGGHLFMVQDPSANARIVEFLTSSSS